MLFLRFRVSPRRVLLAIYTVQRAYDVPVDGECAVDSRVRLPPIRRPYLHPDPLLTLPPYDSPDPVRLLIPVAIAYHPRRGLLLEITCFRALVFWYLRQIVLSFAIAILCFCLFFLFVSLLLF